jgi:hypothetical protein
MRHGNPGAIADPRRAPGGAVLATKISGDPALPTVGNYVLLDRALNQQGATGEGTLHQGANHG